MIGLDRLMERKGVVAAGGFTHDGRVLRAVGDPVEVAVDALPGEPLTGRVSWISAEAEFTPKNVETPELRTRLVYQVRVFVCNPERELRLGMPATVTIPLGQDAIAAVSPEDRCAVQGAGAQ